MCGGGGRVQLLSKNRKEGKYLGAKSIPYLIRERRRKIKLQVEENIKMARTTKEKQKSSLFLWALLLPILPGGRLKVETQSTGSQGARSPGRRKHSRRPKCIWIVKKCYAA
jgi:hypothetical protein